MSRKVEIEAAVNQISKFETKKIKKILWVLCYNPKKVFETYGVNEDITADELQEAILEACRKENKDFVFASKEQVLNSYGIDLKISNPIVRDTVIEHCVGISDDSMYMRVCISNLCTRRDNFEYRENRREGFNLLNFSEEEQRYLERETDTYKIGELLKGIQKEKYPSIHTRRERAVKKPIGIETTNSMNSTSKLDSTKLLEHKSLVEQFIASCKNLKEKGLDPLKLLEKTEVVEKLLEVCTGLTTI